MNTKTCEKCGVSFGCGAEDAKPCWCTGFDVTDLELKNLRKKYKDCLCEKCLIEVAKVKE